MRLDRSAGYFNRCEALDQFAFKLLVLTERIDRGVELIFGKFK